MTVRPRRAAVVATKASHQRQAPNRSTQRPRSLAIGAAGASGRTLRTHSLAPPTATSKQDTTAESSTSQQGGVGEGADSLPYPARLVGMSLLYRIQPFVCLLVLAGCEGRLAQRQEAVVQGRVPVTAEVHSLAIAVDFGSITIFTDEGGDAVTFEGSSLRAADTAADLAKLAGVDLTLHPSVAGGVLSLRPPPLPTGIDPTAARMVVRAVVHCPQRLHVNIRTGIGSVKVERGAAGVEVHTGQGEVVLTGCSGEGKVHTEHGDILIDQHHGNLELTAPNGSARAYMAELGTGGVRAAAQSTVEVHMARDTAFTLDAATARGRCHNSFGVPIVIEGQGASMQGAAKGGGARLDLRSTGGPVTVGASE